jgi:hypothetical protein
MILSGKVGIFSLTQEKTTITNFSAKINYTGIKRVI